MDRRRIEENNNRFVAALERGDPAEMADCYTEDARLLPPDAAAMTGREAIEAFWRAGIDSGLRAVKLETLSVEILGDTAFEVGRATVSIATASGTTLTDIGKYAVLHRKREDGAWRWAVDIFNSDGAAQ